MIDRYPYFVYPILEELKTCGDDEERMAMLRRRLIANIGDSTTLENILAGEADDLADFYADAEARTPSTESTIDAFIARFSRPGEVLADSLSLGEVHAAPESESPQPEVSPEPLNDNIKQEEGIQEKEESVEEVLRQVKILVKNRDYEGALAIMNRNYLNNPKKSVYFADQIRFINKMMQYAKQK